jgi:hypothetical protein
MEVMAKSPTKFQCHHCQKKFVLERAFMNHKCTEMQKAELLKTVDGQAAYIHYTYWLRKKGRKAPPIETFLTSSYFRSFVAFAEFIRAVSLPTPEKYIDIMVDKEIAPLLWPRSECYSMFLQWYDNKSPPIEQVDISVNTILDLSDEAELSPSELFDELHIRDIMQLLQERKLSPWFLLCSKKFKEKLKSASVEDNKQLMRLIGINYWASKLESNESVVKQTKMITAAMGL